MSNPEEIVRRWFDLVWNEGREEAVDEMLAADAVAHGLGEGEADVHGPAEFKVFLRNMRTALPDVHIRVDDIIAAGDRAAAHVVLEGTHAGDGLGVPASGNRISVRGIVIIRTADGKIAEGWNSWDQLGLLRQVGALPRPGEDRFLKAQA